MTLPGLHGQLGPEPIKFTRAKSASATLKALARQEAREAAENQQRLKREFLERDARRRAA